MPSGGLHSLRPWLGRLDRRFDLARWYEPPAPVNGGLLLCVYRQSNAANVVRIVEDVRQANWTVRLWSLDRVHADLADWTVGSGPGRRFQLANRLLSSGGHPGAASIALCDDDVQFVRGSLPSLGGWMRELHFDLAQPAHALGSNFGHMVTLVRPRGIARVGQFVEIGPVVMIGPRRTEDFLPFPEAGMGWGVEFAWARTAAAGARIGIIDAVTIQHLGQTGQSYAAAEEKTRMDAYMREQGFDSFDDITKGMRTVRPWRRRA